MPANNAPRPQGKPKATFEVEQHLVLSTGHVTAADARKLAAEADARRVGDLTRPPTVHAYPEGFFVFCGGPADAFDDQLGDMAQDGYSVELLNLMRLTRRVNCAYLHLDRDGPRHDRLPFFNW